jgi:hypothetical protein
MESLMAVYNYIHFKFYATMFQNFRDHFPVALYLI